MVTQKFSIQISDLVLGYHNELDEFVCKYITLIMQLGDYKYIFQLPKHSRYLLFSPTFPLPQHFRIMNTFFSFPTYFYIYIGFLFISL